MRKLYSFRRLLKLGGAIRKVQHTKIRTTKEQKEYKEYKTPHKTPPSSYQWLPEA
jgi:hypothetical protein